MRDSLRFDCLQEQRFVSLPLRSICPSVGFHQRANDAVELSSRHKYI